MARIYDALLGPDGRVDRALYARVCNVFYQVIEKSFVEDRSRVTRDETVRRFRLLEQVFRELREEAWSVERILFVLPKALRAKLDGAPFEPANESRIWAP